jgi:hypothetical protein
MHQQADTKLGHELRAYLSKLGFGDLLVILSPHCPVTHHLVYSGPKHADRKKPEIPAEYQDTGREYPVVLADKYNASCD